MNISQECIDRISGAEKVLRVFGYWPSFHDAEVIWLKLDRRGNNDEFCPTLETQIHAHEMTKDVDERGYYVLRNHVLILLRFLDVVELRLDDFNHQNVLFGLEVSDLRERQWEHIFFQVRFDSSYGIAASFQCHAIEVVEVTPCNDKGIPIPT